MKTNNHYACRPDVNNGMTAEQAGQEGMTQFRMQPAYLNAYALYFTKYIQAYRNEGINLTGIHVQNEMNSCQNFPSCIWTARRSGYFYRQIPRTGAYCSGSRCRNMVRNFGKTVGGKNRYHYAGSRDLKVH